MIYFLINIVINNLLMILISVILILLWKESFTQRWSTIQQKEQSPLILTHWTLEIQVLAWDRHNNMAGLNQLMGSQLFLLITTSYL
jgi:hypothetical protein